MSIHRPVETGTRKRSGRNVKRLVAVVAAGVVGIAAGAGVVATPAQADWVRDFTGEGRGDLTAMFDHGSGRAGVYVWPGQPSRPPIPTNTSPVPLYHTQPGGFWLHVTRSVGGDFNGDGRKDIIVLYDYGNGSAGLFVFPGGPTSRQDYRVWFSPPGNFWPHETKLAAGDYNGDGFDDVMGLYNYGNGQTGMFVWPGTAATGDGASEPYTVYESNPGGFWLSDMEITGGDFTGDGRDDLIALYDYPGGAVGLFVFPGVSSGRITPYRVWYETGFEPNAGRRAQLTTTNWNHDGLDDVFMLAGSGALYNFRGTAAAGDQATDNQRIVFSDPLFEVVLFRSKITSADYGGDSSPELMGMYDVGDGRTGMWVMGASSNPSNWQLYLVWLSGFGEFPLNRLHVTP